MTGRDVLYMLAALAALLLAVAQVGSAGIGGRFRLPSVAAGNRRPPASGLLRRRSVDSREPCTRHDHGRDVGINADQRTDDLVQRVFRNQPVV